MDKPDTSYEFGAFRLAPSERQLLRDDRRITLPPKAFQALVILVEKHGHAVTKEELIQKLWPDSFVEESNLNHYISLVRKALTDGPDGHRYIETVPKFGYRFSGDVREANGQTGSLLIHRRTRRHVVFKEEQTESVKTVSSRQMAVSRKTSGFRRALVASLAVSIVGGMAGAYFGFIKPAHSRSAHAAAAVPAPHRDSDNTAARDAYWKGRYFWNRRTPQDLNEAAKYFNAAIKSDPNYAPAYAGLADCLLLGVGETEYSAKDLARKAIALDETLAEAHASLAYCLSAQEWNWAEAEKEFRRAIELDSGYATAHHWHAYHLASIGRLDEAKDEIRRARELDPNSLVIATDVAHILYLTRGYTQAIEQCQKVLGMDPNFAPAHLRLGEAYEQKEMFAEAISEFEKAKALGMNVQSLLAHAYAASGQRARAQQMLAELEVGARHGEFNEDGMASIYAALGNKDEAFRWLSEAYRRHIGGMALLKSEPRFESLRSDPRYTGLLEKMNLLQ
jgi:DNA-binding winged helix-turn-helix (wHTH) protein/tetratricopeptide (TPR) repeat protein